MYRADARGRAKSGVALRLLLTLTVLGLAGCVAEPVHLDVMSVNGRDSGGVVPSYDSLMRIGDCGAQRR